MVSGSLSLPFRGSFHRSLAVLCAIGQPGIFSLTQWSGQIPTTFHGGGGTREHTSGRRRNLAYGTITLCGAGIPPASAIPSFCNSPRGWRAPQGMSHYPSVAKAATMAPHWFRLFPFRSPLLRESHSLSFPRATKRFCFARFGSLREGCRPMSWRVSPFGHPRITACLRLPGAYRSLPRPSSLPVAEASTIDP